MLEKKLQQMVVSVLLFKENSLIAVRMLLSPLFLVQNTFEHSVENFGIILAIVFLVDDSAHHPPWNPIIFLEVTTQWLILFTLKRLKEKES